SPSPARAARAGGRADRAVHPWLSPIPACGVVPARAGSIDRPGSARAAMPARTAGKRETKDMSVDIADTARGLAGAPLSALVRRVAARAGGRERARVITLLGCVLALDSADKGTVGAVAAELEHGLAIGHVAIGAVATVS